MQPWISQHLELQAVSAHCLCCPVSGILLQQPELTHNQAAARFAGIWPPTGVGYAEMQIRDNLLMEKQREGFPGSRSPGLFLSMLHFTRVEVFVFLMTK